MSAVPEPSPEDDVIPTETHEAVARHMAEPAIEEDDDVIAAVLTEAWQAVDRAIRPLGYGGGVTNSPWNQGYERAKNEALNAIIGLRRAAPTRRMDLADRLAAVTRERDEARGMLTALILQRDEARDGLARVEALCTERDYTTWDQNYRLGAPPWLRDDPRVIEWERNHGHDVRTKCYPEYGCLLLVDPADVRSALAGDTTDA